MIDRIFGSVSLSKRQYGVIGFVTVAILFIAWNRYSHNQLGFDFRAYYMAAERWTSGAPLYTRESESFLFKYAPSSVLFFVPFSWFPFGLAMWLYGAVCTVAVLATPLLVLRIFESREQSRRALDSQTVVRGIFLTFLATIRILDSELLVSQIGSLLFFSMLLGILLLIRANGIVVETLGWLLYGFGAIVKIHSLSAFSLLLPRARPRTWIAVGVALVLLILLPNPKWWLAWLEQMKATTDWIPMGPDTPNLQGFQPFAIRYFGWARHDMKMYVVCALGFVGVWALLPKFSLDRIQQSPVAFLYATGAVVLFGMAVSPLPWQYTYMPFWGLGFASWLGATRRERALLVALITFLALSPKGIARDSLALYLEGRQSFFISFAIFIILLIRQSRRWA